MPIPLGPIPLGLHYAEDLFALLCLACLAALLRALAPWTDGPTAPAHGAGPGPAGPAHGMGMGMGMGIGIWQGIGPGIGPGIGLINTTEVRKVKMS